MLIELLSMAMINPDYNKLNTVKEENPQIRKVAVETISDALSVENTFSSVSQFYVFPTTNSKKITFEKIQKKYEKQMRKVVVNIQNRKDDKKQFLKWIDLPREQQIKTDNKNHLDSIYEQAFLLKSRKNKQERPLVVLGIGGSKHTAEFLLNMNGVGNKGKVYFYSDIDPISFENFQKEVNKPVQDLNFLVVSKSGTTFETKDAFVKFETKLYNYYKSKGLSNTEALKSAQSHFAICTDKTATAKNLRGKIGQKNGVDNSYIKELYIHDGVGGRFSMFDDAGLFTIAYAGVSKQNATRILKGAEEVTIRCLDQNLELNPATRNAIFNIYVTKNGYTLKQQQFFGRIFEGGGENWIKQLYLESIKDFQFNATKAPDSMHYASEGFFFPENRDKYHVIMTVMSPKISANYKKYIGAILESYSEKTPVELEMLEVENNAIKPEAIGEYVQIKHFETIYTGMMKRELKNQNKNLEYLPEVFQPNVEVYKNKFKSGSPYELKAGK